MGAVRRIIPAVLSLGILLGLVGGALPALAFDINNPAGTNIVCSSAAAASSSYCADTPNGGTNQITGQNGVLLKAANIVAVLGGIIAVIMIIIGGIMFTTSGGDAKAVGTAKSLIIYAFVGIIIIAVAQILVRFIIGRL
ncbi:MAG: hypothetical protein ACREGF_05905 [Candidatus Saccharimonadales bacterium]